MIRKREGSPDATGQEVLSPTRQWKPEKGAREIALEAFYRQLPTFLAVSDTKLRKWAIAERKKIVECLERGNVDNLPCQAFMDNVAVRALEDEQVERDRDILEKYSSSPIADFKGNEETRREKRSRLIEEAKNGVRSTAEAARRTQTGIRKFRFPPTCK